MTTRVATETALVGIEKSTPVAPAGMNTVDGGLTILESLLTSRTVVPPGRAALCSVTVALTDVPPTTLSLLKLIPYRIGRIPNEFCPRPLAKPANKSPMIPTETPLFGTGPVAILEIVASVLPAGTVTVVAGMFTCGMSVEIDTIAPPAGAGLSNITRACAVLPPKAFTGSARIANKFTSGGTTGAVTVIARPADQRPATSPCSARTRQK